MTDPTIPAAPIDPRLLEVEAAINAGQLGRAVDLAERLLAGGLVHPLLLNLRAMKAEAMGRGEDALRDLTQARDLAPDDVSVLNALALRLMAMDRQSEAIAPLERAVALAPEFAQAWNNLGVAELAHGDLAAARRAFETASDLQPGFAEPRGHLALMAARRGDRAAARALADAALQIKPALAEAIRALAEVDLAEGRPADAESGLTRLLAEPSLGPNARYLARGLLGDALDRQGRYDEAFEAYQAANLGQRDAHAPRFGRSNLTTLLSDIEETFQATWPRGREAGEPPDPPVARRHIFLIGFMRSGTTLMEQVLASQPDAVTLEEKEVLNAGVTAFLSRPDGVQRLARADERSLDAYRADYWDRVRAYGIDPAGKVFIDKMPFDGLRLPLIHRLFPDAKIIFTIRDPRDVIFSCFKHRFAVTTYTYELLTLPTAVRFYDLYMRGVEAFRARLPLQMHRYRHEDLVADFDGQVKALCGFLDIPWNEAMRDIGGRSRQGLVASPSAPQLVGGLSRAGLDQWRRYEAKLAPYYAGLEPWVRRFGYEA